MPASSGVVCTMVAPKHTFRTQLTILSLFSSIPRRNTTNTSEIIILGSMSQGVSIQLLDLLSLFHWVSCLMIYSESDYYLSADFASTIWTSRSCLLCYNVVALKASISSVNKIDRCFLRVTSPSSIWNIRGVT